jgi:geranylgeranyl pyrophosphate synthase
MMHDCADDQIVLRQELSSYLETQGLSSLTVLGTDIFRLLHAPGKLLSPSPPASRRIPLGFWAVLPLFIARYCQPAAPPLVMQRVALACELLHCALDYYDEIEDDDLSAERQDLGDGRLLNAATTLFVLSRRILASLVPSLLSYERYSQLTELVDTELLLAMDGQHRDILVEQRDMSDMDPEECVLIAEAKAGTLVRLVCRLAACAVDARDEVVHLFAQFGLHLGIAFQLENDAHDLEVALSSSPTDKPLTCKSDLIRQKKTLPVILAAMQYAQLQKCSSVADRNIQAEQDSSVWNQAYADAIQASLAGASYHRECIKNLVPRLEAVQGVPLPPVLRWLLGLDENEEMPS